MDFRRGRNQEEPEINLVPMIDVLLVIIIFLMLTTTYSKFSGLELNLPTADSNKQVEQPNQIDVIVKAGGQVSIGTNTLDATNVAAVTEALRKAAGSRVDPLIVINADAKTTHQSVVDVMQAAQSAGFPHISFATQAR